MATGCTLRIASATSLGFLLGSNRSLSSSLRALTKDGLDYIATWNSAALQSGHTRSPPWANDLFTENSRLLLFALFSLFSLIFSNSLECSRTFTLTPGAQRTRKTLLGASAPRSVFLVSSGTPG